MIKPIIRGYLYSFKYYKKLYQHYCNKYISTGSSELDRIFDYGLEPYSKYLIYGEAGTGKTFLSHQITANFLKHIEDNVIYIDTEGNFSIDLIKALNVADKKLNKVIIRRIYDYDTVYDFLFKILYVSRKLSLLIIDNISNVFLMFSDPAEIQYRLIDLFYIINLIKEKWGATIFVTAKVYAMPHPISQSLIKPKGGVSIITMFNKVVNLSRIRNNIYRALDLYSEIPAALFKITDKGVTDV